MTKGEVRELLLEIAERLEEARVHACSGFHCVVCYPAKNAEELRAAVEAVGALIDQDECSEEREEREERE